MSPARRIVERLLARVRGGEIVVRAAGTSNTYGQHDDRRPRLRAVVEVDSPRVWRMLLGGSDGLARSYVDGLWRADDLVALVRIAARNVDALDRVRRRLRALLVPLARLRATRRLPTPRRSRRQIAAHYDLGNDLFASFLDETMSYSSAIFAAPGASLREAQIHKLDRVCRKLGLSERDHVLEVGCGWGGFAIHAAGNYGCRVTAATISREQHALATERVRAAALEDRVEVILRDYRDLDGRYDKLVSIEMIEAVGWQYFDRYFARCSELLRDDGAMLLQAITIDDRAYEVEKHGRSFMNTLIFPGGCLPSLGAIGASLGRVTDLTSVHLEDISAHYVTTLRHWRERFAAAADRDELDPGRYDARFRRLWELYLAYCEAGFAERRIRDVQLVLAKPAFRSEPLLGVEPAGEQRPALSAAG